MSAHAQNDSTPVTHVFLGAVPSLRPWPQGVEEPMQRLALRYHVDLQVKVALVLRAAGNKAKSAAYVCTTFCKCLLLWGVPIY